MGLKSRLRPYYQIESDFYNEIKIKEDRRGIFKRNVEILEGDLRLKRHEGEMTS
jgi:hypothetical protein